MIDWNDSSVRTLEMCHKLDKFTKGEMGILREKHKFILKNYFRIATNHTIC